MSHTNKDLDDFFDPEPSTVVKMPDVMIDTETMGTNPSAPIIGIGAVAFNLATCELGERYYANVDLASVVAQGAVMDADTVMWWMKQPDEARRKLTTGARLPVEQFLAEFSQWLDKSCVSVRERRVWACGIDFDNSKLSEHYRRAGLEAPWMFWNNRDQRTLRDLYKSKTEGVKREGTHHNALDDAIHQVRQLFAIRGGAR